VMAGEGKGSLRLDVVVVVVKKEVSGEVGLRPRGMAGRNGERYAYISERWEGTLDDTALLHALDEMKRHEHLSQPYFSGVRAIVTAHPLRSMSMPLLPSHCRRLMRSERQGRMARGCV